MVVGGSLALAALVGCSDTNPAVGVWDASPCLPDGGAADGPVANGNAVMLPATYKIDNLTSLSVPVNGTWTKSGTSSVHTEISGELKVVTPPYTFNLGQGQLGINADGAGNTLSVYGTAKVTMPGLHTFSGLGSLNSPLSATFGYDAGASLGSLGLPLAAARKYLYFNFNDGFSGSFGTVSFSAGPGNSRTLIVDPNDPSIYVAGPMGNLSAVALSEKGLIPYVAQTTWGFEASDNEFPSFTGQSFIAGEFPLEEIPFTVSGDVTTRYVGWDGTSGLDKTLFDHQVGVNGQVNVGWDLDGGAFRLEVPVATASMYLLSTGKPYRVEAAISGTAGTNTFLPPWIPVLLSANSSIAGYLDTGDLSKNHIDGASNMTVQASTLGQAIGIQLNDVVLSQSIYHVDRVGFRFHGLSTTTLVPLLAATSTTITACFGGDTVACLTDDQTATPAKGAKDWLLRMEGDVTVAKVPLAAMTATATPQGVGLAASFKTQGQQVVMTGDITVGASPSTPKVTITGNASVHIPLTASNEVLSAVVDGALCGYHKITDAAKCGEDTVNFADEFHCGKPHCHWSWKHGLRCDGLSCSVKVPKTCNGAAKSCKPTEAADFNLGSVTATVALTVTNSGIGGAVSGQFCAAGGGCTNLVGGGTLDFSSISSPKLCLSSQEISPAIAVGKKFCASF